MILLDSDICIDLMRGNPNCLAKQQEIDDTLAISFITLAELFYGAYRSNNPQKNLALIDLFLSGVSVLHSDFNILEQFAIQKANLKSQGYMLPDADILIAATCMSKCHLLVTANTKHFSRFPNLRIENWR